MTMKLLDDFVRLPEFYVRRGMEWKICRAGVYVEPIAPHENIADCDDPDIRPTGRIRLAWFDRDGEYFCDAYEQSEIRNPNGHQQRRIHPK